MGHLGPVGGISVVNKATCVDVTSNDMINSASKEMINKADAVGSDGGETQRQSPYLILRGQSRSELFLEAAERRSRSRSYS